LFLLPLIAVTFFYSIETIEASWKMSETSTEAGGLAYVYIQKTLNDSISTNAFSSAN
jgi:TRAP-type mannitol/chloroaromatic compound transport system permease small subunit